MDKHWGGADQELPLVFFYLLRLCCCFTKLPLHSQKPPTPSHPIPDQVWTHTSSSDDCKFLQTVGKCIARFSSFWVHPSSSSPLLYTRHSCTAASSFPTGRRPFSKERQKADTFTYTIPRIFSAVKTSNRRNSFIYILRRRQGNRHLFCSEMEDEDRADGSGGSRVIDIYPLSGYYFGSKAAGSFREETLADRVLRMKSNYSANGLRTCVEAVLVVELFKHPHLLLLQVRNSFKLPGGRLRPGESEIEGLRRKLSRKLSVTDSGGEKEWEVGECLGMWWRSDFETLSCPYLPPNIKNPKECTKLFLVKLPESRRFIVPRNMKLLAVPLSQMNGNERTYGPIISGVPQLLSKFSFNIVDP